MDLLKKLEKIRDQYKAVEKKMSDPDVISDHKKYSALNKEYSDLKEVMEEYNHYDNLLSNIKNSKEILNEENDPELREMAKAELDDLMEKKEKSEKRIKQKLVPPDPEDSKNAIMEIRAGTGGDEAGIFAGDLFRMYQKFCEINKWKTEVIDYSEASAGGYKEIVMNVFGTGAYGKLKYESGVHRVQRVPKTETQGRIHTSAASVVVLPEAEELDVEVKESDIKRDTFCSSGPGGQSVNTTYSAIRLTHLPTGVVATCQDEKSQIKNYNKALKVLRSRIYEIEYQKRLEEESSKRKTMVSTGDRSAKIRTYNFPQSRITDHRISLTVHNLDEVMAGDLNEIIESLKLADNIEKLEASVETDQ
jgi:peptide chain release factor 1